MYNEDYVRNLVNNYCVAYNIPQRVVTVQPFYRSTSYIETANAGQSLDSISPDPTIWYFTTLGMTAGDNDDPALYNAFIQFEAKPAGAPVSQNFVYNGDMVTLPVTYKNETWHTFMNKGFLWNSMTFVIDKVGAMMTEYRKFNYWVCGYKVTLA